MEISNEARQKIVEALTFAGKELIGTGLDAVVFDVHAAYDKNGEGGVMVGVHGLKVPRPEKPKDAGIPGTPSQVAGAELLRILKSKKKEGS